MRWKYILFDLDGTLTDSREGILNCVKYALEAFGKEIPSEEKLLQFIGPPLVEGFQRITGMTKDEAVLATAKYRERFGTVGLFENRVYDGIDTVLEKLKEKGYVLAVATSKPEEYSVRILEHFHLAAYFTAIVGSTFDESRSRKADVIQEALRRLGIAEDAKKDVIMVGDRKHDILGAQECGLTSLGVYYGFASEHELETFHADHIVQKVTDLLTFFEAE